MSVDKRNILTDVNVEILSTRNWNDEYSLPIWHWMAKRVWEQKKMMMLFANAKVILVGRQVKVTWIDFQGVQQRNSFFAYFPHCFAANRYWSRFLSNLTFFFHHNRIHWRKKAKKKGKRTAKVSSTPWPLFAQTKRSHRQILFTWRESHKEIRSSSNWMKLFSLRGRNTYPQVRRVLLMHVNNPADETSFISEREKRQNKELSRHRLGLSSEVRTK